PGLGIPRLQPHRRDPDKEQEAEPPHQHDGPNRPLAGPATTRREDAALERCYSADPLELLTEGDVLHDGNVRKPADRLKYRTPHKERLIARHDSRQARAPVHHPADQPIPSRIPIESDIESPANGPGIL